MAASKTCLVIDNDCDFAAFVRKVAEGAGLMTRLLTDPTRLEEALLAGDPDVIRWIWTCLAGRVSMC
jgi:hypothetical protein